MTAAQRRLIGYFLCIGITLFVAGANMLIVAQAQEVTPEPTSDVIAIYDPPVDSIEPTGDNGYCLVCHNRPWKSVTLRDGAILNLYVNPNTINASVHGVNNPSGPLGCIDCHGENSFPHSGPTPDDRRALTLDSVRICATCHMDQVHELEAGLHEQAILAGNLEAAVCTDCHGAHNVQPVVEEAQLIAGVCGNCHVSTLSEWRISAHVDIGPLGCATCHSQHSQRIRAGETANDLCLNCHNEMPRLWVHQQHAGNSYPVGCTDCHMYIHEADQSINVSYQNRNTGHSMQMTSLPCNTCHEQLLLDGTWARLGGSDQALRLERDRLQQELTSLREVVIEQPTAAQESYVPLLQGLLLGLGLGATVATVFVARGAYVHRETAQAVHDDVHGDVSADAPAIEDSASSASVDKSEDEDRS